MSCSKNYVWTENYVYIENYAYIENYVCVENYVYIENYVYVENYVCIYGASSIDQTNYTRTHLEINMKATIDNIFKF